ncbi:CCAAT- binding transcription factor component [Malassezia yamatoensis]|uniref:CCAAT- binding transcription factor component n=1 Tax=Malassezia yamatoensis TaxID=253288 RepID=A0AAJ6CGI1_9BASI|nr:CCAAT- binding transcription factor component [Malassezia yamatoensis]
MSSSNPGTHPVPAGSGMKQMGSVDGQPMSQMQASSSNYVPLSSLIQQFSRNPGQFQRHFWRHQMDLVENGFDSDGKTIDFYNLGSTPNGSSSALPLARIKKVMKNDDEVKRSDIANAIARSDLFDFLIDIVPRSEMMRNRCSSLPIRTALPSNVAPVMSNDAGTRSRMHDPMLEAKGPGFLPLRPNQPDLRNRLDGDMGMSAASQAMKGLGKPPMNNEWASPMYSFSNPGQLGDARMQPSAPMGMRAPPSAAHGMPRGSVEASPFMDAGSSLPMPSSNQRGSFLNMVSYPMDENKGDSAQGE